MGVFQAYLKPFDEEGNYGEWVNITKYVNKASLSAISQQIEGNSDYQLGVFTYSSLTIKINNRTGKFSDVETIQSIFRFKRADTQFKITWQVAEDGPYCGIAVCGEAILNEEIDIYKGLVNDESFSSDAQTQEVSLKILGFESLFQRTIVPFDSVDSGDPISETIFEVLNQSQVTELLTVSQANIVPGIDQAIDSIASLQNKTVKEGIAKLLEASNSVLYIINDAVYVKDRSPGATPVFTFFGQASRQGAENILDIDDIKNGVTRVVNYATWEDTVLVESDDESITRHGYKKKSVDFPFFTDNTKRTNILSSILADFAAAKQEFDLTCSVNYDTLALNILDRVLIDYPTVYLPGEEAVPICGIAEWGDDVDGDPLGALMPEALWSFQVSLDEEYKIISRKIDIKNQKITFRMRKI